MAKGRKSPKLWMICFGVKQYTDSKLEDLTPAVNNCRDLNKVFEYLYPKINNRESIIICDNDDNEPLPNKKELETVLAKLKNSVASQDILLFYLYGHGHKTEETTYYCFRETNLENLEKTAYSLNTLVAELKQITAQQTLVFLDTCYSGNININYSNRLQELGEAINIQGINNKDFYLFTSCLKTQESFMYRDYSLYAFCLIKALAGGINALEFTCSQLHRYIQDELESIVLKLALHFQVVQGIKQQWNDPIIPYAPQQKPGLYQTGINDPIIFKRPSTWWEHFPRKAFIFCHDFSHPSIKKFEEKLKPYGCFEVEVINSLKGLADKLPPKSTILLYLRGDINEEYIKNGDRQISLQALRDLITPDNFKEKQLILCLDSLQAVRNDILNTWVDSLKLNSAWGNCIVASQQSLLKNINKILSNNTHGLTAAELITQLQQNNSVEFPWLAGENNILEIIPEKEQQDTYKKERFWVNRAAERLDEQERLTSNVLTQFQPKTLKELYVPLELWEKKEQKNPQDIEDSAQGSQLYNLGEKIYEQQDFFNEILANPEICNKHKGTTIVGEAGAGKTSYLQKIAFWILDNDIGIPVWVSLKNLKCSESEYPSAVLETYIRAQWIPQKMFPDNSSDESEEIINSFFDLCETGRVWLLLDAADEMALSEPLSFIHKSLQGKLARAKVVLTCRQNLWQSGFNPLNDFQCYRTRPFSDEQIKLFIQKYFARNTQRGEKFITELFSPGNESIKDTIRIPLFLTMLSFIWQKTEAELEFSLNSLTKNEIFDKFINSLYEWKKDLFSLNLHTLDGLSNGLGKLALEALESDEFFFRLPETAVAKNLGDLRANNSLFTLACQLGLLNYIGG